MTIKIGIVTTSDRASRGEYEDISGPAIQKTLTEYLACPWEPLLRIVPDQQHAIEQAFCHLIDDEGCCLVVSTGGTGPAPRDVTPEATEAICEKMLPGFGECMRMESLKRVPTAILSRQMAGIRGEALIINLPGKPQSIRECLDAVFPAVPYCIELIGGPSLVCNDEVITVFRPNL